MLAASLAAIVLGTGGLVGLLVTLLVFILVAGLVYWAASALLPHPVPLILLIVIVLFALIYILGAR